MHKSRDATSSPRRAYKIWMRRWAFYIGLMVVGLGIVDAAAIAAPSRSPYQGIPSSRAYAFHDIGHVPRGSRLSFDTYGRVAVVHDGVYTVLNDTVWINYTNPSENSTLMSNIAPGKDGRLYFGAAGMWGFAEIGGDGQVYPKSLAPKDAPAWAKAAVFDNLQFSNSGVIFGSRAGFIYRDYKSGDTRMFEFPKLSQLFCIGDTVYVSSFDSPLMRVQLNTGELESAAGTLLDTIVVERAVRLDEHRALVSLLNNRLYIYDGATAVPWDAQDKEDLNGRISALARLADGNIALTINGEGVFILSPDGKLNWSFTTPEYHRVANLAANEAGVLWMVTEDAVRMVWYGSGLSTFGQSLGLPAAWPVIASFKGKTYVATDGDLYAADPSPGRHTVFKLIGPRPPGGVWSLGANERHLLIGNVDGLYTVGEDHTFTRVGHVPGLAHLVMLDEDACFAIGPEEIALFEWDGTTWVERAPRVAGAPGGSIVHRIGRSAWVEQGPNGVLRLTKEDGVIKRMALANTDWTDARWVNVGQVGNVAVLSATRTNRRFFDEDSGTWIDQPEISALLDRGPLYISRVQSDNEGNLWGSHFEGVVRFRKVGRGFEEDSRSFELINDHYPIVHILRDGETWFTASQTLCHVDPQPTRPWPNPSLVALHDTRAGVDLLPGLGRAPLAFGYARNSLAFRFFAGTYAWQRPPVYEYRLDPTSTWSTFDPGSLLRFPDLRTGEYKLEVRVAGAASKGEGTVTPFTIFPPWYRTLPAYFLFAVVGAAAILGAVRWSTNLARARNRQLERIVQERTNELEATMRKLNEETRITATLAERDRVAGEIHDSVQQGLTGAILQLESTLKHPSVAPELQGRLKVVKNMVSYARQEVQHAVWDVGSPLLEGNDLGAALRKLSVLITPTSVAPEVLVEGTPAELSRHVTHHLLRVAQEATANAIRHSGATKIRIRLVYGSDVVRLSVEDNGGGFSLDEVLRKSGHFGLRGIRARAKKADGECVIHSTPQGTTITVTVPRVSRSELSRA